MEEKKIAKAVALVISFAVLCLSLQNIVDWSAVGIYTGCGLICRMIYPLYHANLLHATLNTWCLLSVIFIYDISLWRLVLAYVIAIAIPSFCLSDTPAVGLSGVVFVLFGSISFEVQRKAYYQLWMLVYLIIGFLSPNTSAWIHLYCYLVGCVVAILNKPIRVA